MPRKRVARIIALLLVLLLPLCIAAAEGETPSPDAAQTEAEEIASETEVAVDEEAPEDDVEGAGLATLKVDTVDGTDDSGATDVDVALTLENCTGVDSLQLNLNYDANALKVKRVVAGDVFPAQYVIANYDQPGLIRIACAGLDVSDGGTVLTVTFAMLTNGGSAVTVTDAEATRYTPEEGQVYAYITLENGGVLAGGALPAPLVTPWSPPTPTPSPTPVPTPTIEPTPVVIADEATPTPEPTPEPVIRDPQKLLPVVIAVAAVLLLAVVAIVIVSVVQNKKKKKRRKRKKRRQVAP